MRALTLGFLTFLALAAPAAAWQPIAGRYGGHEIHGTREIHFCATDNRHTNTMPSALGVTGH
jgi:hypothetical protein